MCYGREMLQKHQPDTLTRKCQAARKAKTNLPPWTCLSLSHSIPFVKKVTPENWEGNHRWCESGRRCHLFWSLTAGKLITCPCYGCKGHSGPERACRRGESCLLGFLLWGSSSTCTPHSRAGGPVDLTPLPPLPTSSHTISHLATSA